MAKGDKKQNIKPSIEFFDPVEEISKKFDFYIKIVLGIFVIALSTMLIMTATLIIDAFHFNSVTYQEYSKKVESQNLLLGTNKQSQELIRQNQKTIEELIRKISEQ